MTTIADSPTALLELVRSDLGSTGWVELTDEMVRLFELATGTGYRADDVAERGPNEKMPAHRFAGEGEKGGDQTGRTPQAYLLLSLVNLFLPQLLEVRGASMGVNVGLDQVLFPAAVPPGCRIRGRGVLTQAAEAKGGVQVTVRVTVEAEGPDGDPLGEPACVADTVSRFLP